MNDASSFVSDLVCIMPEFKQLYDDHLEYYDELLPHVFMGDLTRFAITLSTSSHSKGLLERLFKYLELGLQDGASDVKELIVVSFVENLTGEKAAVERFQPHMGLRMRAQVQAICGL